MTRGIRLWRRDLPATLVGVRVVEQSINGSLFAYRHLHAFNTLAARAFVGIVVRTKQSFTSGVLIEVCMLKNLEEATVALSTNRIRPEQSCTCICNTATSQTESHS